MTNIRQLYQSHIAKTNTIPMGIEVISAEGIYMFQPNGSKIWDMISGICVSSLGHRHPEVVAAIHDQTDRYLHTMVYGEFILSPQAKLAAKLSDNLPSGLDSVYFTMSGSEAVEGALKTARRHTRRTEIISCRNAYHGSTMGSMTLMSDDYYTRAYRPLIPDVRHIDFNSMSCLSQITKRTACVILEPIQAEAGILMPRQDYLKALKAKCKEVGALLIFDEIQVGMGRTGSLYAFTHYDVVPDILLTAKGLGGGMPIGAFISSKKIMAAITDNPMLGHITTFGGHPVSAAAGLATLKVLVETNILDHVEAKANLFIKLLADHSLVKETRHKGLFIAIDFDDAELAQNIIARAMEEELMLLDFFLFNDKALRIAPPLNISQGEIYQSSMKLRKVMDHFIE